MAAAHLGPIPPPDEREPRASRSPGRGNAMPGLFDLGLFGTSEADEEDLRIAPTPTESSKHLSPHPARPGIAPKTGTSTARSSKTKKSRQVVSQKPFRGRYIRALPLRGRPVDLAWDAILRKAVRKGPGLTIRHDELLKKQRIRNPGRLLLMVTDISGSMGTELMALAKTTALALLERAYVKRDHVSMVAFRDQTAELLFPPTNQAELVRKEMADLPCGGTTPLSRALELAEQTLARALVRDRSLQATVILISDGKANIGMRPGYKNLTEEIERLALRLACHERLEVLFLDTTEEGKDDFPARWLAEHLNARRFLLWQMIRDGLDPASEIAREAG